MVLVGAGDLGHALVHSSLRERGFRISAIFDNSPDKIGARMDSLEIQDIQRLPDMVQQSGFRMAIVAVAASRSGRRGHIGAVGNHRHPGITPPSP